MAGRKPTQMLKMNGSLDRHPERKRARSREMQNDTPIGQPPNSLGKDEAAMWHEIVAINPPGLLTSSDRLTVEVLSILFAKFRRRESMSGAELNKMLSCISLLGGSPVDRSKVVVGAEMPTSPFSEFTAA